MVPLMPVEGFPAHASRLPDPLGMSWIEVEFIYYDGPLLFLMRNETGDQYLVNWADADDTTDTWLCVRITPDRLSRIVGGGIPLREAYLLAEEGEILALYQQSTGDILVAKMPCCEIPVDWLSEPDVYLNPVLGS